MPILEHYGTTETSQVAANLPLPGLAKPGTCGVPEPDTVMIMGEDGARVPVGEWGELWVGGPTVARGYIDDNERTRATFIDGWFRTGDRAMIDEEGFLIIGDRLQDVINRGGEKISPMEIEVALLRHPAVAEAAAFAVPHPRLGDDVGAAVVLFPDATARSDDLRRFLATQLAWFKIPRRIRILDSLPKGATGKVQRKQLAGSRA
jgi:acyl-CoA synthetase (AMP-forming)/AMP-acid ligase II